MIKTSSQTRSLWRSGASIAVLAGVLALSVVGVYSSVASAQSTTDATGSRVTDFVETLTVAKFDAALGELALAELTTEADFRSRVVEFTNDSANSIDTRVRSSVEMCVTDKALAGGNYAACEASTDPTKIAFAAPVLAEDFVGVASGATVSSAADVLSDGSRSLSITDPSALQSFVGPGSRDFEVSTLTEFSAAGGGGNQTVVIETYADIVVRVRYEYANVTIETLTNGVDGAELEVGAPVTWTYTVTNSGTTDLVNLIVTDDLLGDVCVIPALAIGAVQTCSFDGVAGASSYLNNGTVIADTAVNAALQVNATDPSSYAIPVPTATPVPPTATPVPPTATPVPPTATVPTSVPTTPPLDGYTPAAIDIELTTNGVDADLPAGPSLLPGDEVRWTYTTVNTGTVPIQDVVVVDTMGGDVCIQPYLNVAESFTCELTSTACSGNQQRTASVRGVATTGVWVEDSDPTHHNCDGVIARVQEPPNSVPDEVQGQALRPDQTLAVTGGGADGPVVLAVVLSVLGILAVLSSDFSRRRFTTADDTNELYATLTGYGLKTSASAACTAGSCR